MALAQIFDNPKFIIYKAENGWALYVPKDESVAQEYGSMVSKMMGQFGVTDPLLEKAKSKSSTPKIHGLFLFDKWEDMIGFIKIEFEQEIDNKTETK